MERNIRRTRSRSSNLSPSQYFLFFLIVFFFFCFHIKRSRATYLLHIRKKKEAPASAGNEGAL